MDNNTTKTQIWTVVQIAEGDTLPWNTSYSTVEAAVAAVRAEHAEYSDVELEQSDGPTHEGQVCLSNDADVFFIGEVCLSDDASVFLITPTTLA